MLFIKFMVSIKQMLLISSLITYLFIICLILVNEYLCSFLIQSFYSCNIIIIIYVNSVLFNNYSSLFYVLYLISDLIKIFIIILTILLILY